MPASHGLFARAIMESGACAGSLYFGPREAEAQGRAFERALGCQDLTCMRAASAGQVLAALPTKQGYVVSPGVWWGPVVDGTTLPLVPLEALRRGQGARVPLILGWNRDEGIVHAALPGEISAEQRDGFVRDSFGEEAVAPAAARYKRTTPKESFVDIVTDAAFACQNRRAARAFSGHGNPVFLYQFTHALASPRMHALGATHSVELWFVFGTEEAGIRLAEHELPLSRAIMDAWGRFARTGDPAGPGLPWPRYTAQNETLALLDTRPGIAANVKKDECAFWDQFERQLR
jgi:para-nitrobenzyl esterase